MHRIYIYDTTLRDGAQSEGISYSLEDKKRIAGCLDAFGMDFVEGGMPVSNPIDREFLSSDCLIKKGAMVAFGSTCRPDADPSDDAGLKALADCGTEWVCIFGKAWDFHVTEALETALDENLRMVRESVAHLKSKGKKVIFDAEHFFDGYRSNAEYAMETVASAAEGGAEWIVLCDTNGGNLPDFIGKTTKKVSAKYGNVGIHCHNDSDTAVASTIAAVENGATMVQGTVNGYGERCGNANLCSVIPILKIKLGYGISADVSALTDLSRTVSEIANTRPRTDMPFVGTKAFVHKGGMHVSAMTKNHCTYEHIPPETVGNKREYIISDMSGRASVSSKLKEMGIEVNDEEIGTISEHLKKMAADDYSYENADASFKLLADRVTGRYVEPFGIEQIKMDMDGKTGNFVSKVSIKAVSPDGVSECTVAESDKGPVNALDASLRSALTGLYPEIRDVRLIDYKVRVIDERAGTEARVRVLITSTDGRSTWNTVGVSENVIEASLMALLDSYEYAISMKNRSGKQWKK